MRTYNQTPESVEKQIVELYMSGKSSVKIRDLLGIDPSTIIGILRRYGVKIKNLSETKKKYFFNDSFFENIDSEEKAYWYGFILADGNISRGKDVTIALARKDRGHIVKFIQAINGNNKIYDLKTKSNFSNSAKEYKTENSRIGLRSEKMVRDLNKYGMTEKKSFTASVPVIPSELYRHFWRGVIDGDGHLSLYTTKKGYNCIEFGLCGSLLTITSFIKWAKEELGLDLVIGKDKSIFRTKTSGKKAFMLAKHLYYGCLVSLDRKYQKFLQMAKKYE